MLKAYNITCFDIQVGKHTIVTTSEDAAIASFKRTYPRAVKVFASEAEEPCDMADYFNSLFNGGAHA